MKMRKGRIDVNVLDRSVVKKVQRASLGTSVQRMSAETVSIGTSRIGELAVCKALNALAADTNLSACRFTADPCDLSSRQGSTVSTGIITFRPTILLPEGSEESVLRNIMDQICETCRRENLKIEGGYTEVTSAVTRPVVIGSCALDTSDTVRSELRTVNHYFDGTKLKDRKETDISYIVMTKWAGIAGTYLLACDREEELGKKFPESILSRMKLLGGAMSSREEAVCARNSLLSYYMQHSSDSGIFAALWGLSKKTGSGFSVDLKKIPVLQETIETANYFDLNPYQMDSTGSLLIVTDMPGELIAELKKRYIPAAVIGKLTDDNDKKIVNGGDVRYLDRPQPDELLKVYI